MGVFFSYIEFQVFFFSSFVFHFFPILFSCLLLPQAQQGVMQA